MNDHTKLIEFLRVGCEGCDGDGCVPCERDLANVLEEQQAEIEKRDLRIAELEAANARIAAERDGLRKRLTEAVVDICNACHKECIRNYGAVPIYCKCPRCKWRGVRGASSAARRGAR